MLDLIIVTILTLGLAGFLTGLVVVQVKHDTAFMTEALDSADKLIAKAKQWREVAPPPTPGQSLPRPAIQPVP